MTDNGADISPLNLVILRVLLWLERAYRVELAVEIGSTGLAYNMGVLKLNVRRSGSG